MQHWDFQTGRNPYINDPAEHRIDRLGLNVAHIGGGIDRMQM